MFRLKVSISKLRFCLDCLPTKEQEQQVQPRLAGHGRDRHHWYNHLQSERGHGKRLNTTGNDVIIFEKKGIFILGKKPEKLSHK